MSELKRRRRKGSGVVAVACLVGAALSGANPAPAQVPGLPGSAKPAETPKPDPSQKPIPAKDTPGAVFSATSGPIQVNQKVADADIEATLDDLLSQYPGVRAVSIRVKDGVVKLDGQVDDDDTVDRVTGFTMKVVGVRLVLNRMQTDAEVLSGPQIAMKVLGQYRDVVGRNWLLAIVAVESMVGFAALARAFAGSSEALLSPFVHNPLLRSVVGSILSSLLVLAGILLGLSVLDLTQAVVSVLGLASIVGLALGFAFRDIAENFIASMLLGLRRPFQIGDFVTVAGKSGSVLSLDTRATMLITPEGNHVRIPNAVIYKETLINASTTPSTLGSIEILVPYVSSTADALAAISEALQGVDGLIQEPKPRALVQALEVGGVRIKATYWMPTKGIDGDKLQSDLRLKIKVALQKAGITPGSNPAVVTVAGRVPIDVTRAEPDAQARALAAPQQSRDNLRKDARAADRAEAAEAETSPIDHAIHQAQMEAATEGNNLLANGKS